MWVPPSNCVDDALVLSGEVRPRDYNIYTLNENFKTMAARASLIGIFKTNTYLSVINSFLCVAWLNSYQHNF